MITRRQRAMIATTLCNRMPKYFHAIMEIQRMSEFFDDLPLAPRKEALDAILYLSDNAVVPLLRDIKTMLDIPIVAEFLSLPEERQDDLLLRQRRAISCFQRIAEIGEPKTEENKDGK